MKSRDDFDVNAYWLKRGRGYADERLPEEYHRIQEQFLLRVIHEGRLPMNRVLELGCGFGRVTRLIAGDFPEAQIVALDLSPEQLNSARRYCGGATNIVFHNYDFYSGKPFPGADRWDATIAIEVFLHHPEALLRNLISRLGGVTAFIVNVDWSESWPWGKPEHVWVHDYAALYRDMGLQCATFVLPRKVDGLQHRLFVAGRELPVALIEFERKLGDCGPYFDENPSVLPPVADWMQRLKRAIDALRNSIPENSTVILVNDDQWGCEGKALPSLRLIPFLERDGCYWGTPADDTEALRELSRLQKAGAKYIAVAWNAFWWLEHYREFHLQLRRYRCVLSNDDLIIFQL